MGSGTGPCGKSDSEENDASADHRGPAGPRHRGHRPGARGGAHGQLRGARGRHLELRPPPRRGRARLRAVRRGAAWPTALRTEDADFTHVFLLGDGEATRDGILAALRDQAGPLLGPQDVFVLYFAGHGIGADLGLPTFFAHDSTLANGQEDGLELATFAREVQSERHRPAPALIVTDAIHAQAMEGFTFYRASRRASGPSCRATRWWSARPRRKTPGKDGAFGEVFATAIGRPGRQQPRHDGHRLRTHRLPRGGARRPTARFPVGCRGLLRGAWSSPAA